MEARVGLIHGRWTVETFIEGYVSGSAVYDSEEAAREAARMAHQGFLSRAEVADQLAATMRASGSERGSDKTTPRPSGSG